ncbi:MAG: hypothetical protein ACXIT4_01425 [Erythrobacter sp.]
MTAFPPGLRAALSASQREVAREIETLGTELCSNPAIIERHIGSLQQLDRCAQVLNQLAQVIEADHPASAIAAVTLEDVRIALEDAMIGGDDFVLRKTA